MANTTRTTYVGLLSVPQAKPGLESSDGLPVSILLSWYCLYWHNIYTFNQTGWGAGGGGGGYDRPSPTSRLPCRELEGGRGGAGGGAPTYIASLRVH